MTAHSPSSHEDPDRAIDPVCGMEVSKSKARFRLTYKGKTYYFCAAGCLQAFAQDAETYLKEGPKGMPEHGHH